MEARTAGDGRDQSGHHLSGQYVERRLGVHVWDLRDRSGSLIGWRYDHFLLFPDGNALSFWRDPVYREMDV